MCTRKYIALFSAITLTLATSSAISATLIYLPSGGYSQSVAANDSTNGNIWTGVAQSFTAQDPNIYFGFYTFLSAQTSTDVMLSLFSGDGQFSSLLLQRPATLLSGTSANPSLLEVDFSSVTLSVGSKYTVAISLPGGGLPAAGTYSNISILYAGVSASGNPNPYQDGTFYYTGSSYLPSLFFDRDIAFRAMPAAIPEPSSYVLVLVGIGLFGVRMRRANNWRYR